MTERKSGYYWARTGQVWCIVWVDAHESGGQDESDFDEWGAYLGTSPSRCSASGEALNMAGMPTLQVNALDIRRTADSLKSVLPGWDRGYPKEMLDTLYTISGYVHDSSVLLDEMLLRAWRCQSPSPKADAKLLREVAAYVGERASEYKGWVRAAWCDRLQALADSIEATEQESKDDGGER